jgi:hypothetical protein
MTKSYDSVPQILAARDAWLAAMAALEEYRLEVNRLWLEYLELADPGRAKKIRRILKHAEQGAAKTADELFPAAVTRAITTSARAAACTFAQSSANFFDAATRRRRSESPI